MTTCRSQRTRGVDAAWSAGRGEILQLTAMRSTKYGSLERYFVALARGCSARGWSLVLQYNESPRSSRYVGDLRDAGATTVVQRLGARRVSAACRSVWLMARHRPRIVHLHFCGALTRMAVGLLAPRLGVTLTLATVHATPNPRSRLFARASYARIDRILCVSQSVERTLVGMGVAPAALTTHYLGVPDLDPLPEGVRGEVRDHLAIPKDSPVLVTVVFNNPMKGVDVLVDAFLDYLTARYPDLHLICLLYTSPSPRDRQKSRMPSSA